MAESRLMSAEGVEELRAELHRLETEERAKVVEHVAKSGKPSAFRPGREAQIVRRLLRQHMMGDLGAGPDPDIGIAGRMFLKGVQFINLKGNRPTFVDRQSQARVGENDGKVK